MAYGEELDVTAASAAGSWTLSSDDDGRYGPRGRQPLAVHRKAKVRNTDHDWNFKLDHWIFLRLPQPMTSGSRYTLRMGPSTHSDTEAAAFSYDLDTSRSEAIHVNLIGYTPKSPVKAADLYLWLGDGGARDYSAFEGNRVWLFDVRAGERHPVGEVTFWKKSATEAEGRNLTGSDVWTHRSVESQSQGSLWKNACRLDNVLSGF